MKSLTCDCGHVVKGKTVAEVMKNGMAHGMKVHKMKKSDFTPAIAAKYKKMIKSN
ncbi:MAG: DUF1059 domain-containing protein [Nanoarchaeota archaeon]